MSTTDALTITSAPDALTRYYCAKEREESAVLYINDAYLEVLNSLENLEAENGKLRDEFHKMDQWHSAELIASMDENAKLRELVRDMYRRFHGVVIENWSYSSEDFYTYEQRMRELGVEV